MATPMSAYAQIAARFAVDPQDEEAVDRFFLETAPTLPTSKQIQILQQLFEADGAKPAAIASAPPVSTKSPVAMAIDDAPPVQVPPSAYAPGAKQTEDVPLGPFLEQLLLAVRAELRSEILVGATPDEVAFRIAARLAIVLPELWGREGEAVHHVTRRR